VARDPVSGDLGVGVQSHWFSVGSVVSWAQAGVGAVATQSVAERAYGPRTLARLAVGEPVQDALQAQLDADKLARMRQVAAVAADGSLAVHTGKDCIPFASHVIGDTFTCQANMMAREGVPEAMAEAFTAAEGPLAERMIVAMEAAERAGGDVRGRQSAALVVAPAEGEVWDKSELRIEDHPDPVTELRRLHVLERAYALGEVADELMGAGDTEGAGRLYVQASEMVPESDELLFWAGLSLAEIGNLEAGVDAVRRAAQVHPGWLDLLDRLSDELAPSGAAVREALRNR
jgi:uncharacterized Ntn-hydrolase superfamily protein